MEKSLCTYIKDIHIYVLLNFGQDPCSINPFNNDTSAISCDLWILLDRHVIQVVTTASDCKLRECLNVGARVG